MTASDDGSSVAPVPAPSAGRAGRGRAAGALLLAAALTGLSAVPTWLTATTESVLGAAETIRVSGAAAAPTLVAAALVLLAATGAVALVGRIGRWVVVATVALAGLLVVGGAVGVLRDPAAAMAPAVADQIGIERVVGDVVVAAWPWVALGVGLLDVLLAVWLARASGGWSATERRDRHARPERHAHGAAAGATAGPRTGTRDEPVDERDQWDALSRGDDPSEADDPASGGR
ncbi:Trp biosynthesis-associated membrane protein [Cellulomonas persica]|uniref:Trp biosynthesis protein n=1 Tax=Cellulomonas persica TaxID=76861 RepID=A0A510UWZ1_9CELL|nr:Trp biosynthesis-associated membrane protein [Cellulomonas persica]GEK19213.1 hypothetical protein CPE01_29460 [Cellulomonas persica]